MENENGEIHNNHYSTDGNPAAAYAGLLSSEIPTFPVDLCMLGVGSSTLFATTLFAKC